MLMYLIVEPGGAGGAGDNVVALFRKQKKADEYAAILKRRDPLSDYEVQPLPVTGDVPKEYVQWEGYAFKYRYNPELPYTQLPKRSVTSRGVDDLHFPPEPLRRAEISVFGNGRSTPFYVVHVEGTDEDLVREHFAKKVEAGERWLKGLD